MKELEESNKITNFRLLYPILQITNPDYCYGNSPCLSFLSKRMSVINFQSWHAQDSKHFVRKHSVFYKSVHCMVIFRFYNAKRLSFLAKLCSWRRDCRPKGLRILRHPILKRFPGSKIIHCMFAKDVLFPDRKAEKLCHTPLINHRTQKQSDN